MLRHWRDLRNDLIADPRFQSFAARFFLTRRIAASQARQAFDLAAGFVYSQILLACAELNLFEALRGELSMRRGSAELRARVKQAVKALNGAAGRLRHLLVDRLRIRHVPTLHFSADMALRDADRVGSLIRTAIANDKLSGEAASSSETGVDEPPAS